MMLCLISLLILQILKNCRRECRFDLTEIQMKEYSYGICPYKIQNNQVLIYLNKTSEKSLWNFFKGKSEAGENTRQTAIREFYEEAGVLVQDEHLEEFFTQSNYRKDIGIFLVDFNNYADAFILQKSEIYKASWISILDDYNDVSANQCNIYNDIFLHFKMKMKNIKHLV